MLVRQEQSKDFEAIYTVVKRAFKIAEHSDGNEQDLVNSLRRGAAYISELSLKYPTRLGVMRLNLPTRLKRHYGAYIFS